ncbi:putative ribonuclease H-like domain-containing protein [Tanacetum coccineum]
MTHPSPKRNMVPKAVLMRSGKVSLTTARPVNTAQPRTTVNSARPMTNVFNKSHSTIRRPINNKTTTKNSNFNQKVNTARQKAVLNVVKGNQCINHPEKSTARFAGEGVIDNGCSRHMTGNMSYLIDFEEINEGYVAFGGNLKGGKITGRVPRKDNMYSVDLKNIIPKEGLTYLFAKATSDESKLWHRRLGHINFKTMNKLVKGNLVRGLSSKILKIHQTFVACQKGKQHRASYDYSRFSWVFFLATKDETSGLLKSFITRVENLIDQRVRVISAARTPQQNGVAERKRTLIETARTMLADSNLPTTFLAEAVNTACYVQNRVLVTKPHNKTLYELFLGRKPALGFMRPFGCLVSILNTIDHLGKFDGKADEGFFIGYLINSKAFRVFNSRTRIVEENLHVQFSENAPNIAGNGPNCTKVCDDTGKSRMETVTGKDYILLPLWTADSTYTQDPKSSQDDRFKPSGDDEKKVDEDPRKDSECDDQEKKDNVNSTNNVNTASSIMPNSTNNVNAASINEVNVVGTKTSIELPDDPNMPELEDIVYLDDDGDVGVEADMNNLDSFMPVSLIPTTRVHKDHPIEQIIGDLNSAPQTRRMTKNLEEHEAMQEELLQFKLQKVWTLVDLPNIKRPIERIDYDEVFSPVARIEAIRLFLAYASFKDFVVFQMDVKSGFLYGKIEEEVYVYQPLGFEDPDFLDRLDNGFQREKIDKTLFIRRDKGDILLVQVYVDDIIFGSTKKSLCTEFEKMMHKKFQMSSMGELTFSLGLQVKQKNDGIFISQDKYVTEILKKFGFTNVKTANTPMKTQKPLLKDENGEEVDVHLYRSMIGSLMYLTSSRPNIMFAAIVKVKTVNGEVQLQALVDRKKIIITELIVRRDLQLDDEKGTDCLPNATIFEELTRMGSRRTKRKDTEIPQSSVPSDNVADEAVNEEMDDSLVRATTTATGLDAKQDRGNINKTQSKATPNEPSSSRTSSGCGPRRQETMGDTTAQTRRVFALEETKTTQAAEISLGEEDASKQGRKIVDIDAYEDIYLVNVHTDKDIFGVNDQDDADMFDVNTLTGDEVIVDNEDVVKTDEETRSVVEKVTIAEETVSAATTTITDDETTLSKALAELKSAKPSTQGITTASTTITADSTRPKRKWIVMQEPSESTPTVSSQQPSQINVHDKGKGIMVEEPLKMKKKDRISFDEQEAIRLQAKFNGEKRLISSSREEELSDAEMAGLFVQFLEQRRKHFVAKRAEEKRNRPPTKAQQRSIMCTYLKNMDGWKPKNLKNKPFANIQELFDNAMKRVNTFVDYRTKLVEESSKKAEAEIAQESNLQPLLTTRSTKKERKVISKLSADDQSKATPNEPSSQELVQVVVPGAKNYGDTIAQLRRVLALEETKTTQAAEISLGEEDASKQGRKIVDIDAYEDIYLVNVYTDKDIFGVKDQDDADMFDETRSVVEEVTTAEETVSAATTTITDDETTLSKALAKLKSAKPSTQSITTASITITADYTRPKAKWIVMQEPSESTPTVSSQQPSQIKVHDKGKGNMVEEPLKMKKKDQIRFDKQDVIILQVEFDEEERLAREKAQQVEEVNIAWDDIQAKIDADYQLDQRFQAQEQEELSDAEKARLFVQFLEQRGKHFVAKRAEEKRNRPPTKVQQRSIMCTYLKNMDGWKPKNLKNKPFANIQELFDNAMKRVNTFVEYRTELVEESSKKAEAEIAQESSLKRAGKELEQESFKNKN